MNYDDFWNNLDKLSDRDFQSYSYNLRSECRSSTLFPIFKSKETQTKIEFLSYWVKKHNNSVVIRFTIRNLIGEVLNSTLIPITKYKAINYEASSRFNNVPDGFVGSVEVEIYSKLSPLFKYPALTLSISNKKSTSVIHSGVRSYNKDEVFEDYALKYPQTGFDIDLKNENKNFIIFFGAHKKKYNLIIQLKEKKKFLEKEIFLNNYSYGQTHILYLEELFSTEDRKIFKNPKCSIKHDVDDLFPRFYAGIINETLFPSLTHSFYDTSEQSNKSKNLDEMKLRADNKNPSKYFDTSFMIPVYPVDNFRTSIKSYAQNLNFSGYGLMKIISSDGTDLFSREFNKVDINNFSSVSTFEFDEFIQKINTIQKEPCSIFFGFVDDSLPFPKRFKLALNIKKRNSIYGTNICFAPQVISKNILSKPFTRRWFPIGGSQNFIASVHNTKLLINDDDSITKFSLEFINYKGDTLKRDLTLKANGTIFLNVENDEDLKFFFKEHVGWCMVNAETCFFDAYYLSTTGVQIGGDHAF